MFLLTWCLVSYAQTDSLFQKNDSVNRSFLQDYSKKLTAFEKQRIVDSIKKADLESQLVKLKTADNLQKEELLNQLKTLEENEKQRIADKKAQIEALRSIAKGYPVTGVMTDTLFLFTPRSVLQPRQNGQPVTAT